MNKILNRNRNMYNLSIVALVLYVLFVLTRIVGPWFFNNPNGMVWFYIIIEFIIMFVLWFGYISVYVLWTPDSEGAKRKRPTWQFVLLLAALLISRILNSIISLMMTIIEFGDFSFLKVIEAMSQFNTLSLIGSIIHYMLLPVILAMIIILLVKCERKAKRILIIPIVSSAFAIVSDIMRYVVKSIDDFILQGNWATLITSISTILAIAFGILMLTFTLIYTRQKYSEVKLHEPDIGIEQ